MSLDQIQKVTHLGPLGLAVGPRLDVAQLAHVFPNEESMAPPLAVGSLDPTKLTGTNTAVAPPTRARSPSRRRG